MKKWKKEEGLKPKTDKFKPKKNNKQWKRKKTVNQESLKRM